MLPRRRMATKKKDLQAVWKILPALLAVIWLAGCTPPGPGAVREGKRLIDEGEYEAAGEKLKLATSLLRTNAMARNYLGIACQHAGQPAEAQEAYQNALK